MIANTLINCQYIIHFFHAGIYTAQEYHERVCISSKKKSYVVKSIFFLLFSLLFFTPHVKKKIKYISYRHELYTARDWRNDVKKVKSFFD